MDNQEMDIGNLWNNLLFVSNRFLYKSLNLEFFIKVSALFLAYLAPVKGLIHSVVFVVVIDMITGIWKATAIKNGFVAKWKSIKSSKLKTTVNKLILYCLLIILLFVVEKSIIGNDSRYLAKLGASIIFWVELKSVTENMDVILGTNIFTSIYKKAKELFSKNKK